MAVLSPRVDTALLFQIIDQHGGRLTRDSQDSIRARLDARSAQSAFGWRPTPTDRESSVAAILVFMWDRG